MFFKARLLRDYLGSRMMFTLIFLVCQTALLLKFIKNAVHPRKRNWRHTNAIQAHILYIVFPVTSGDSQIGPSVSAHFLHVSYMFPAEFEVLFGKYWWSFFHPGWRGPGDQTQELLLTRQALTTEPHLPSWRWLSCNSSIGLFCCCCNFNLPILILKNEQNISNWFFKRPRGWRFSSVAWVAAWLTGLTEAQLALCLESQVHWTWSASLLEFGLGVDGAERLNSKQTVVKRDPELQVNLTFRDLPLNHRFEFFLLLPNM